MNTPTQNKILVLEFNELSPVLMNRFIKEGKLPNFKALRERSDVYTTIAEEKQENLEPWIQWPTIHTGLSFAQHGLSQVGEGHKLSEPRIWDIVSAAGKKAVVFGSMNVADAKNLDGLLMPDPWTTNPGPSLPELKDYTNFVGHYVQEHTNVSKKMDLKTMLRFLKFMVTHGLSPRTVLAITKQLWSERFARTAWKRVAILDALQLDVFRHYYGKIQPDFATFFLNSTAHLQHMHWRNMDPATFELKPSDEEQKIYANAILFGYQKMDALLGNLMDFVGNDVTLVFATALSQQPCTLYENIGGKRFCRPIELADSVRFAGVTAPFTTAPVMAEEFYVHMNSEAEALDAEKRLNALRVGDHPAFLVQNKGKSLFVGCKIWIKVEANATLDLVDGSGKVVKQAPFFKYFYQVEDKKSGMHHPEGMLWMTRRDGEAVLHTEKLPLTAIAPTFLSMLGIQKPQTMTGQPVSASA